MCGDIVRAAAVKICVTLASFIRLYVLNGRSMWASCPLQHAYRCMHVIYVGTHVLIMYTVGRVSPDVSIYEHSLAFTPFDYSTYMHNGSGRLMIGISTCMMIRHVRTNIQVHIDCAYRPSSCH